MTPGILPLRLRLDGAALVANWRWLRARGGRAACGAAVKADGYGLGAAEVVARLAAAGCRDFYVATWAEAAALGPLPDGVRLAVLHGARAEDMGVALASPARPVLNTAAQVARWREAAAGRACDVMVDTGMNRLGLSPAEAASGLLDGLALDTLTSHLACADDPAHPMNERQRTDFAGLVDRLRPPRASLANSAGICMGEAYAFDLTRPGLALYGGVPEPGAEGAIAQVAHVEAQILQVRDVAAGESVGYGADFVAARATRVGILNLGYGDGYLRAFGHGHGRATAGDRACPVLGRVSMDLTAVDLGASGAGEGDWLEIDYRLPQAAAATGLSQYELLTGLGGRYQRLWS